MPITKVQQIILPQKCSKSLDVMGVPRLPMNWVYLTSPFSVPGLKAVLPLGVPFSWPTEHKARKRFHFNILWLNG